MAACLLRVIRVVTAGEGMGLTDRVEMVEFLLLLLLVVVDCVDEEVSVCWRS